MTKQQTRIDAQANALWEERCDLLPKLNRMGKERRRLTELLPWWAAPGRSRLSDDGSLTGPISPWPAIQGVPLPHTGCFKIIRPSPNDLERECNVAWYGEARAKALLARKIEAFEERYANQKKEMERVGLAALERRLLPEWHRLLIIRNELVDLANDHASEAAIAAASLLRFSDVDDDRPYGDYSIASWDCFGPSLGVLKRTLPACRGRLRKHVAFLVEHPRTLRRTCRFLDVSDDAMHMVTIDRDRIPETSAESQAA